MATADETPYGNTETATLRVGIYFTQTQTQSMKAFAFSSVNSLFWFGNSRIPRRRPGTTTFGGGRWICIDADRRHLRGFRPSDLIW